jgi:large subunit ribosomal protein L25
MSKYEINVKSRDAFGKCASRRARKAGMIPANIYMHGAACRPVLVDVNEWKSLSNHDITLINLKEGSTTGMALIKEVQYDTLKNAFLHIDFQSVRMDEKIHASVPVHPASGVEPIGIAHGGILEQPLHAIEVSCLPTALPEAITIDLSALEVDHSIHVKDLIMPEGVSAVSDPDAVVFHMIKPSAAEVAPVAAAEVAPAAVAAAPAAAAKAPAAAAKTPAAAAKAPAAKAPAKK